MNLLEILINSRRLRREHILISCLNLKRLEIPRELFSIQPLASQQPGGGDGLGRGLGAEGLGLEFLGECLQLADVALERGELGGGGGVLEQLCGGVKEVGPAAHVGVAGHHGGGFRRLRWRFGEGGGGLPFRD